jgi:hypothetical protein
LVGVAVHFSADLDGILLGILALSSSAGRDSNFDFLVSDLGD